MEPSSPHFFPTPAAVCYAHSINLCEVYYQGIRRSDLRTARAAIASLYRDGVVERRGLQVEQIDEGDRVRYAEVIPRDEPELAAVPFEHTHEVGPEHAQSARLDELDREVDAPGPLEMGFEKAGELVFLTRDQVL